MNLYQQLKERTQAESKAFPVAFAFDDKQFKEGMEKLGLLPTDTDKIYKLGDTNGFYKKTDAEALFAMLDRHEAELKEAIAGDITGEGFILDMFSYELANHEYVITYNETDALEALNLTSEEVASNPILSKALQQAKHNQWEQDTDTNMGAEKPKEFELEPGVIGIIHNVQNEDYYTNPDMTYLDEVEDDCWELFKGYAAMVGVEFDEDSEIDFSIAKAISEKIIEIVEENFNISFPLRKQSEPLENLEQNEELER